MKSLKKTKIMKVILACLVGFFTFITSCKKEEVVGPAPVVTLGASTSGLAGVSVTISANISAENGIKSLQVLKNGVSFDTKTFNTGTLSDSYSKAYVIESLPSGTVVNFTFIATDYKDLTTLAGPLTVTVASVPAKQVIDVTGTLEGNITWTADKIYKLKGFVRIGEDKTKDGTPTKTGVLTIQPGTVIIGERATKGTLIIQRGSKIIAEGTVDKPIVFTSERNPGEREPGDWGGLVICGKAKNNLPGGTGELEGQYGAFHGGTDDTDNSGSLKYVRIEYAGIPINPNQEVNSLTLGSVGSGTKIEYVMCSYGLDDSFEMFGGTVSAKYLIAYRGLDDDFDMDNGYIGNVQFAIGLRGATQADQSGSNGFEVDNDGSGSAATPITAPTLSNVSLIGPKATNATSISPQFQNGMHLRRNTKIKVYNSFITAYPNGIFIDGTNTAANAAAGELVLKNIVVAGVSSWGDNGFGNGTTVNPRGFAVRDINTATPAGDLKIGDAKPSAWFLTADFKNKILINNTNTGINENLFLAVPVLTITTGKSDGLEKDGSTAGLPSFFTTADFIGAFGTTNWASGWTEFNPATKVYDK